MHTRSLSPLRCLAAALTITALSIPAQAQFGMSETDEMSAGGQADAQIQQKYRISHDRYMNNLVTRIGRRLTDVCERPNLPWTFRVIDSKEVNAFSVPAYVYVNSGLIDAIGDDQDALACVIGHEIGHTCGKHAVKQSNEATIGSLLVAVLGGRNRTFQSIAGLGANLVLLGHSRGDEYDADRRGIRYAYEAGYDPNGMIRFFDRLKEMEGNGRGGLLTYFQTHPNTGDRITRAGNEIARIEEREGDRTYRAHRRSGDNFDDRP